MTENRTFAEVVFERQRATLALVLVGLPLACWLWVIAMARDMYGSMMGSAAWMMRATWDAPYLLLLWAMWAAMMAAMMLPSAAPFVLLYARAARQRAAPADRPAARIQALAAGYLLVWGLFSAGATLLQRLLAGSGLLTPMMEPSTSVAAGVLLGVAGVYQLTPLKQACLKSCRTPLSFLTARWRGGAGGALRMGIEHGAFCLGCCWALMLLLFAGGVMNLFVVLALTAWVAIEKLAPFGEQSARVSGALLLLAAVWVVLR